MKLVFTLALTLLFVGTKAQLTSDSLLIEGRYRSFHYFKPAENIKNRSLVFVLHGSGGDGKGMIKSAAKLEALSSDEHFIVVYPDGYKRYWNECRKASTAAANTENVDENAFFRQMIGYFADRFGVNRKQVFAVGTSGGGHMAYKLAFTMPREFRAVTAIIANIPDSSNMDCIEARVAIPVMIVNGTDDNVNPYNGGEVRITGVKLGTVYSTEKSFGYWARLAGYKDGARKELLPDTDPSDGKTIERYTYYTKGKPEVTLLKVIGGRHDYPNDIDVHVEAWAFFKRQLGRR